MLSIQAVNVLANNFRILDRSVSTRSWRQGGSQSARDERKAGPSVEKLPERVANWRFDPENPWSFILSDLADVLVCLAVMTVHDWVYLTSIHYRQHISQPKTESLPHLALGREIIRSSPAEIPFVIEWPGGQVTLRPSLRPLLLTLDTRMKRASQIIRPWLDDVSVVAESPMSEAGAGDSPISDSDADSEPESPMLLTPEIESAPMPQVRTLGSPVKMPVTPPRKQLSLARSPGSSPVSRIRYRASLQPTPAFEPYAKKVGIADEDHHIWNDWVGLRP